MRYPASFHAPLLTVLVGCAALSACGSPTGGESSVSDDPAEQAATAPFADNTAPGGMTGAAPSEMRDLASPVGKMKIACSAQLGAARAADLVKRCVTVSPATHPPCNAANSCAMIEGEIARGCALMGGDATKEPACGPDPRSGAAAKAAIERYYSALNAYDYPAAWQVWGPDGSPKQTYDEFLKGYAQTARATVMVGTPGRVEGAAGSLYVTVPVIVDAQLDSGREQHFTGSYTLRQVNIEPSQGWHITSADLKLA